MAIDILAVASIPRRLTDRRSRETPRRRTLHSTPTPPTTDPTRYETPSPTSPNPSTSAATASPAVTNRWTTRAALVRTWFWRAAATAYPASAYVSTVVASRTSRNTAADVAS